MAHVGAAPLLDWTHLGRSVSPLQPQHVSSLRWLSGENGLWLVWGWCLAALGPLCDPPLPMMVVKPSGEPPGQPVQPTETVLRWHQVLMLADNIWWNHTLTLSRLCHSRFKNTAVWWMTVQTFFSLANIRLSFLIFASFFPLKKWPCWFMMYFDAVASNTCHGVTNARSRLHRDWPAWTRLAVIPLKPCFPDLLRPGQGYLCF